MMKKILFATIFLCAGTLSAQWSSDSTVNTPVCTALGNQQNPRACSDDKSEGIIIVWEDFRSGHDWDIYAQKLNSDGVAQWAKNGINICTSLANQTAPVIASDGNGGAYVAWKDSRNSHTDIYGQHINSDGSLAYGASGAAVGSAANVVAPDNLSICSDGFGNAFVAWQDSRTSITPSSTRPDIYMNKLTGGGAAWGAGGSSIISQPLTQTNPQVTADGAGGCYLVWVHHGVPAASIYGNRVNSGGGIQWGSPGVQIFGVMGGSGDASRNPSIHRDGNQLCVAYERDNSSDPSKGWNIFANRLNSDSTFVWGNNTSSPDISTNWVGDQINPVVFPDDSTDDTGTGGLLVIYENYLGNHDIVMTRLMPDGNALKPAVPNQLFPVCNQQGDQTLPKAVKTGSGEVLIVWNDTRSNGSNNTYSSIYAQRCDRTPKRFLGPAGSTWGIAVSNRVNSNADEVQLVSRTNGGIAAWRDDRNGANNTDIYAQLIFKDGSLPVELENFSVTAHSGSAVLDWQTASERDNAGFEIERRSISTGSANTFEVVGSYVSNNNLRGAGFSNAIRSYSFIDRPGKSGVYEYRLADYSLDGTRSPHEAKTVEISDALAGNISIGQYIPNPFSDKTILPVTLSSDAAVTIRICDILGREISTPYNNAMMSSGSHELRIDGSELKISGSYYCIITITDPQTGNVIYSSRQSLILSR